MVNRFGINNKVGNNEFWMVFIPLFFIAPFVASIFALIYILRAKPSVLKIIGSITIFSLINITIEWRNVDYCWYIPLFKEALKTDFSKYIWTLSGFKEPMYNIITYILSHLCWGNGIIFSIFSTTFFYSFMIAGLVVIRNSLKLRRWYLLLGIGALLYFPYIFANSANHVRQYWATSIVFFSLSKILFEEKKKYWIPAALAFFIHTSSGLISFLALIPFLKYRISLKNTIFYAIAFAILFSLSSVASALLPILGDTILYQALYKAAYGTTFETQFTIIKLVFAVLTVGIPLLIINSSQIREKTAVMTLVNIQLMLTIFIAANLNQAEFCVRMNEYIWCFLPATLMIVASVLKWSKNVIIMIVIGFISFFVIYQAFLTKNTYYCGNDYLWQNLFAFFDQSRIK